MPADYTYLFHLEYRSFINALKHATQSSDPYVRQLYIGYQHDLPKGIYKHYVYGPSKHPSFKVKDIAEIAQASANFFIHVKSSDSLKDRVSLLRNLEAALIQCATKIEFSIKRHWWYWILNLFGYEAKCPDSIRSTITEIQTYTNNLPELEKELSSPIIQLSQKTKNL